MQSRWESRKRFISSLQEINISLALFPYQYLVSLTGTLLNHMLKSFSLHLCFSLFALTFHPLSAYDSSRVKQKYFFILVFLLRERKNVIWDCKYLWLGSGRCFKILDQRTYRKVIKRTNDFKATCFNRFDATKHSDNVRKSTFLGSLHLQQKVLTTDQ